jgi:hypothetical protein
MTEKFKRLFVDASFALGAALLIGALGTAISVGLSWVLWAAARLGWL